MQTGEMFWRFFVCLVFGVGFLPVQAAMSVIPGVSNITTSAGPFATEIRVTNLEAPRQT